MAIHIKYTTAELASFETIAPTCIAIEAAFDHVKFKECNNLVDKLEEFMTLKGVNLGIRGSGELNAIVYGVLFNALYDLDKVVKYQGTFPLRLALVNEVESRLIAEGKLKEPQPSHYQYWINTHASTEAYRAKQRAEAPL